MIDHVSIGVRDIAKSKQFYDAALEPLGYQCLNKSDGSLGYGSEAVALWISAADRPVPPDMKSGLHFCFTAPDRRSVDYFYRKLFVIFGGLASAPGSHVRCGSIATASRQQQARPWSLCSESGNKFTAVFTCEVRARAAYPKWASIRQPSGSTTKAAQRGREGKPNLSAP